MNEEKAALKIQRWFRQYQMKKLFVDDVRKKFEELSAEVGDQKPYWKSTFFCLPEFDMPPEVEHDFIESNIAHRLAILKYQSSLEFS